jgi:hypothetical protein
MMWRKPVQVEEVKTGPETVNVIIRADTQGSVDAITSILSRIPSDQVQAAAVTLQRCCKETVTEPRICMGRPLDRENALAVAAMVLQRVLNQEYASVTLGCS